MKSSKNANRKAVQKWDLGENFISGPHPMFMFSTLSAMITALFINGDFSNLSAILPV